MSFGGDIDKFVVELDTKLRNYKKEFGMEATKRMADITPVVTGKMQKSWGFNTKAESIEIYNTAPYSKYVNDGTPQQRPQRIIERTLLNAQEISDIAATRAKVKK